MPRTKRINDGGHRIIDGLNEAIDWTTGKSALPVTLPGQPTREMTVDEYRRATRTRTVYLSSEVILGGLRFDPGTYEIRRVDDTPEGDVPF